MMAYVHMEELLRRLDSTLVGGAAAPSAGLMRTLKHCPM
jgi:hypothetical protein